jgi:hypothetical protein
LGEEAAQSQVGQCEVKVGEADHPQEHVEVDTSEKIREHRMIGLMVGFRLITVSDDGSTQIRGR